MAEITRQEAFAAINDADDPHEYERAITYALKALKEDVPRQRIDATLNAIDNLPKLLIKDKDENVDVYVSLSRVFEYIKFYTDGLVEDIETPLSDVAELRAWLDRQIEALYDDHIVLHGEKVSNLMNPFDDEIQIDNAALIAEKLGLTLNIEKSGVEDYNAIAFYWRGVRFFQLISTKD